MAGTLRGQPMALGRAHYRIDRIIGDVTYEVVVYAMPSGFYSTFRCPLCDLTEVNASLGATDTDAISSTFLVVDAHHMAKHQPFS
jgi:hypothetical protein